MDAPGGPPAKGDAGSLYDYAAARKNRILPAGEWNQIRAIARGPTIRVHLNGELIQDVRGDRAPRGSIGLQNHDGRSVASIRNILLARA